MQEDGLFNPSGDPNAALLICIRQDNGKFIFRISRDQVYVTGYIFQDLGKFLQDGISCRMSQRAVMRFEIVDIDLERQTGYSWTEDFSISRPRNLMK